MRYHAKEMSTIIGSEWYFEEIQCRLVPSSMLLVRIVVGKVENGNRLVEILRNTPIRQGQPGWNYVWWVKEALEPLEADKEALGTRVLEWDQVRDEAMAYCQRKKDQHRFDEKGDFDGTKAPTYDLIEQQEIIE